MRSCFLEKASKEHGKSHNHEIYPTIIFTNFIPQITIGISDIGRDRVAHRVAHKPRPKRHHSWYQVVSRFHNFTTKKLNNCNNCSLSIREFSDQLVFCVFPSELVCIAIIMRCCSITNNGSTKKW